MKAPFDSDEQLSPELKFISIQPISTPKKQQSSDQKLNKKSSSPHQQMMLIETPIKNQPPLIESLLESNRIERQPEQQQQSSMIQQELSQNLFVDYSSEERQNQNPNITITLKLPQSQKKPQMEIQQNQEEINSTFKTPGRSYQSNVKSIGTAGKRKPCTCKKSGCQKKYCQCFKAGQICDQNCDCIGCKNNDLTQLKSTAKSSVKTIQIMCKCRKSNCLKGYCDCHSAGMMCSDLCNCIECKNTVHLLSQFSVPNSSKRSKKVHWSQLPDLMQDQLIDQ